MPKLTLPGEAGIQLHYTDSGGDGRPVVLIHGWPMSGASFDANVPALTAAGHRVVTYDRRGFGQSDQPTDGYDYDTLASDLNDLMTGLDLTDAVILGFSMGGGEVARYIATYGEDRLAGAVLSGSICPALGKTDDNPDGAMPLDAFEGMAQQCEADQPAFLDQFTTWFFSNNEGLTVPEEVRQQALAIALQASPVAGPACIRIWPTDLRDDCAKITVPLLVIHGDGDQNVPLAASGARMPQVVPHARLHVIEGGPHGANVSHTDEWDRVLAEFLGGL
ncbi:MAG: alpha/beta hydrolase [Nigerium sp.]|nr:alpha/beta hydrolase [Nigerium sp.]